MFELVFGWLWPDDGKFRGYTQEEGSEVVKQLFCKYKDKIAPEWFDSSPWMLCDVVMDCLDNMEFYEDFLSKGCLKTVEQVKDYLWNLTLHF